MQQQYSSYDTEEGSSRAQTSFETIYNIKIDDLSLRELLLMQSIFMVERPLDISALI